jgi:hypothetical protein
MPANDDNVDMILFLSIVVVGAFGALAHRFGADSRPGFDERRRFDDRTSIS